MPKKPRDDIGPVITLNNGMKIVMAATTTTPPVYDSGIITVYPTQSSDE